MCMHSRVVNLIDLKSSEVKGMMDPGSICTPVRARRLMTEGFRIPSIHHDNKTRIRTSLKSCPALLNPHETG